MIFILRIANLKDVLQFFKKKDNSNSRVPFSGDLEGEFKRGNKEENSCVEDDLTWQDDMVKDFIEESVRRSCL